MAEPKHPVRTVDRALEIVELLRELDGAGVSEVASRVDIGKSAVHNHLQTLAERGYVDKIDDEYHVGLSFLSLGAYARNQTPIHGAARTEVDKLADETGELASLLVEKNGLGVYLYQAKGDDAVELDTYEGKTVYLHSTALGKALLAFRSTDEVDAIIDDHGLPAQTAHTITDREELHAELAEIRDQRYATDHEERINGLRCIAAPITDDRDRSVAAVSISCPVHQLDDERFYDELPDRVRGTANVIELEYNYS